MLRPIKEPHVAAIILNQRGAAFNPIAIIIIDNAAYFTDLSAMDMTTHHAIYAPEHSFPGDNSFIFRNELNGVFDFLL
jgi:hypothetical protein